jgi:D-threo-aldose 1-dehydrogenase
VHGVIPTRPLGRRGLRVTELGLGCAALGNLYAEVSDAQARASVEAALDVGVRFFDTAPLYGFGLSERRLGDALRTRERDEVVLETKAGRLLRPYPDGPETRGGFVRPLPFEPVYDYSWDGVLRSLEQSLQRLGVDRVDVLLLHDIGSLTHGEAHADVLRTALDGGYRALDELRSAGTIGALGLGVNEWQVCLEFLANTDPDCFLLAGRYTLLEQTALERFLPECAARGIGVVCGGPYNSGLLASEPDEGSTYDYAPAPPDVLERARALQRVCASHGVPLAAAALRFPLLHPAVSAVIPGARSADEVRRNAGWLEQPIPDALWSDLVDQRLLHPEAPTPSRGAPSSEGGST